MGVKGYKHTSEAREKIRLSKLGRKRPDINWGRKLSAETKKKIGQANWKGDRVGYFGIHAWMRTQFGKPRLCDHCGTTMAKSFDWANVSGEYKRDRNDWLRLCTSCHRKFDFVARCNDIFTFEPYAMPSCTPSRAAFITGTK